MKVKKGELLAFGVIAFTIAVIFGVVALCMGWPNEMSTAMKWSNPTAWIGCILSVVFLITGVCLMVEAYNDGTEVKEKTDVKQ
jgi:uncharacterized membrane protein HdeD (DUF308 family)